MLDALLRYAVDPKHHLVTEPGFKPKSAKWAIQLSGDGKEVSVLPLGDGKTERLFAACPELKINNTAHPLLAEAGVVTLLTAKPEDEPAVKLIDKHRFFLARLEEAAVFFARLSGSKRRAVERRDAFAGPGRAAQARSESR
jgi:hypothetical protein